MSRSKSVEESEKRAGRVSSLERPKTPMLNRLDLVSGESNKIGEFIDWLRDVKKIELCEDYPRPPGGFPSDGGFHPTHQRVEALLADFFEIDLKVVEDERRAILDYMSELNS